jgi:hypothetical protein
MNYLTLRHNHRRGGDPWPFSLSENRRFDLGGKIRCCKSVYQFTRFELYINKWKRRVEILIGIRSLNAFPSYLRFVIMPIINFHFNLFHCNRIFRLIFHSCPMQSRRFHRGNTSSSVSTPRDRPRFATLASFFHNLRPQPHGRPISVDLLERRLYLQPNSFY